MTHPYTKIMREREAKLSTAWARIGGKWPDADKLYSRYALPWDGNSLWPIVIYNDPACYEKYVGSGGWFTTIVLPQPEMRGGQ